MSKRVLDVGQCPPDHAAIRRLLEMRYAAEVTQVATSAEALEALSRDHYDLVLVNRKLDFDYSDGIEVLKAIKADESIADVPVMLVTNYPEHQQQAVEAGGERGFGKLELNKPLTLERLDPFFQDG
jgi:two-component system chemotaxis response regulator CheY